MCCTCVMFNNLFIAWPDCKYFMYMGMYYFNYYTNVMDSCVVCSSGTLVHNRDITLLAYITVNSVIVQLHTAMCGGVTL